MLYAPWRGSNFPIGEGPVPGYEHDPTIEPGGRGPGNDRQQARAAERLARINALRANPMFKKSATPIPFNDERRTNSQNRFTTQSEDMLNSMLDSSDYLRAQPAFTSPNASMLFAPRQAYPFPRRR
jgi:hypothetical protein